MGYDPYEDSELANLPPEAYGNVFDTDGPFDPDDNWLEDAPRDEQITAVREWFLARFCDPAHETPYNGREGGYIYIHGGPYHPGEELEHRFSGIVDDDLIEEVAEDLRTEVGDDWAPKDLTPPDLDEYDERYSLSFTARSEPLQKLRQRIHESKLVLTLEGEPAAKTLAQKLVFGSLLSTLEAFLWETADYWVSTDDGVLRAMVTQLPLFRDESIKLGDIFDRHERLRDHVLAHLQSLVWHRWKQVGPIFEKGLGIKLPSLKQFDQALGKRHDIVHRSGHTKQGEAVVVTPDEIEALCGAVDAFAAETDRLLSAKAEPEDF